MTDLVVTVCYGMEQYWEAREDAMHSFMTAMLNSEGSERERYASIYCQLAEGKHYCTDTEEEE